ncbi:MAG: hypothetical protein AAF318_04115 [Pseudomonadota bacterium]
MSRFTWVPVLCATALLLAGCQSAGIVGVSAPAASSCLDPSGVADPDIRRASARISAANHCVTTRAFTAGGRTWTVFDIDSRRRGPLHVGPHDDENASLPIALYALDRLGGRAVVVEAGDRRFFQGVDPNRHFSNGRASAARCAGGAPDPAFAGNMLKGGGRPIIAYHTNDNGYAGGGGSGTISIRRATATLKPFPARGDEDNLILVAGRSETPGGGTRRTIDALNAAGVHVVYEVVSAARDDCSLSNHLILGGGPRYFNIEVQHGAVSAGERMVDALQGVL